ncbi:MAG: TraR/DksA C4-type zinc finger protein [Nitrospirae bacterium]|nr:TraR/DksA C4-type zinc finger protein [Nitrospirota bacterium]
MPVREDIDLEYFKARLTERREALLSGRDARRDGAEPVELDQARVGRISRMDAMQQQAMSLETTRRADLELQRIAVAFGRIDSGDYGYCLKCEETIAEGRLRADPAATVCIDCANKSSSEKR